MVQLGDLDKKYKKVQTKKCILIQRQRKKQENGALGEPLNIFFHQFVAKSSFLLSRIEICYSCVCIQSNICSVVFYHIFYIIVILIINISLFPHLVILFNHKNKTYSMIPIIKETSPATISLIRHFLLFIFYSKARESLSNCIDSSAIMDDFLSAVSNSVILDTILFTFPLIMSYSSITLLLSASTLLLALYILIKSSIFTFILSFSFGMLQFLSASSALFKNEEANDIEDESLDTKSI